MVSNVKQRMAASYPDWHKQPLSLSQSEMDNPESVLRSFFERYDLKDLRIALQDWLRLAHFGDQESAMFFINFSVELLKMLEASAIATTRVVADASPELLIDEDMAAPEEQVEETGILYPINEKERYYLDWMERDPIACLRCIFQFWQDNSIKNVVHDWYLLAVNSERENEYNEGGNRAMLYTFCGDVHRLAASLYALLYGDAGGLASDYEDQLLYSFGLSAEEIAEPLLVLAGFKSKYSMTHARAELWYLLDAVTSYKGTQRVKSHNILFEYELLLCMIKAAYILDPDNELVIAMADKAKKRL